MEPGSRHSNPPGQLWRACLRGQPECCPDAPPDSSAALLGVAVDAVGGPGQGFEAVRVDRLAANLAGPEATGVDAPQGGLDHAQVQLFPLAELLATLALRNLGRGGRLGTVSDARMFDLFGELEPDAGTLGFERLAGLIDDLSVHA